MPHSQNDELDMRRPRWTFSSRSRGVLPLLALYSSHSRPLWQDLAAVVSSSTLFRFPDSANNTTFSEPYISRDVLYLTSIASDAQESRGSILTARRGPVGQQQLQLIHRSKGGSHLGSWVEAIMIRRFLSELIRFAHRRGILYNGKGQDKREKK